MQSVLDYPLVYTQHVAWGDMDAFGHVNNVMYYRYVESARLAYIEHTGILSADVLTVVASNQCKYLKPVFYPDQLKISARIEELRNSAFVCTIYYGVNSNKHSLRKQKRSLFVLIKPICRKH